MPSSAMLSRSPFHLSRRPALIDISFLMPFSECSSLSLDLLNSPSCFSRVFSSRLESTKMSISLSLSKSPLATEPKSINASILLPSLPPTKKEANDIPSDTSSFLFIFHPFYFCFELLKQLKGFLDFRHRPFRPISQLFAQKLKLHETFNYSILIQKIRQLS